MIGLRRKSSALLLAAALAVPALTYATVEPADAQTGVPLESAGGHSTVVTLITGDRLTLLDGGGVAVEKGEGREHITFLTKRIGDRLHVVPSDAVPLLNAGRLDPRLFDVTTLVEFGYDDRRDDLPLIVTGGTGAAVTALNSVDHERSLPSVRGTAVSVEKSGGEFWKGLTAGAGGQRGLAAGTPKVWLDGLRKPTLDESVPQIGAPAAWQAGYTGEGMTVAVVDTGIDESHPDLADRVAAARDFTGTGDEDTEGHGTHVASTIAGSGAESGGRYQGVAPGVTLLDAKVCIGRQCPESFIIAGMQWATAQGAKVVNMSLSGPDTPELDPLEQAVENLTAAHGTLFVTAAGNDGHDESIGSPASADAALAVGAVTKSDELARFSSRGPRVGDAAIKPDVTAPGVEIVAARSSSSSIGDPASQYVPLSGTSMATPHVAGAAAILAQRSPGATPAELKAALMASASPNPDLGAFAQGAGRIDVARAIGQQVTTSPPSLSFGRQPWPHDDDLPLEKTVTYRNSGTSPVTVDLDLQVRGPDGSPAPDGMFTLDTGTVTVPAGGEAQIQVTADTSVDGPTGYLTGYLVASGDGVTASTPLAVDREDENHKVTVVHTDRNGDPAVDYNTYLVSLDRPEQLQLYDADGTASVRVPEGRYALITHLFTDEPEERSLTELVQPVLTVEGDQTVHLDARTGERLDVSLERPGTAVVLTEISAVITADWGQSTLGIVSFDDSPMYSANVGPDTPAGGFVSFINTHWVTPDGDGSSAGSPYYYHLVWVESGRMFDGLSRTVRDEDLAEVRAAHAGQGGDLRGAKASTFVAPEVQGGWAPLLTFPLPFARTEFYNTDGGLRWRDTFLQTGAGGPANDTITETFAPPATYRAGHRHQVSWNQAVFGPTVPTQENARAGVVRSGDLLIVNLPMYGDRAGRMGITTSLEGRTALYRDGVLVGETDLAGRGVFAVAPEPAEYRLEVTADHDPRLALSTSVSAAWTFRSEHVDGGGGKGSGVPQALSTVRFMPALDVENAMRAGRGHVIPIRIDNQAGSAAADARELTVEASYDDGGTWQPVHTILLPWGSGLAIVPRGEPGFVSLRAEAGDADGNSVKVTIIRAYRLAG